MSRSVPVLLAAALLTMTARPASAHRAPDDRTQSPYFEVTTPTAGVDPLPLKETRAEIQIAGVIAQVRVTQVYENRGPTTLEAIYVFPGSTRAAVSAMRMKIGERTIEAKIEKKDDARKIYEQAKREGKSASLLEQARPNVFQMNVANILPGDVIQVEMDYSELLVPEEGVYELVYPTVVGPRYAGSAEASAAAQPWTQNPYLAEGRPAPYRWGLKASLSAGLPIQSVMSPSHQISPRFQGADRADIEVDDATGGNRDFVLRYRLSGDAIEAGLLLYPGDDENFFLMMMQPPKRIAANALPPREYIFIIDISGSMNGFPLTVSKEMMRSLLGGLRSVDSFNVLLFAGDNSVLSERSLPATPSNIERAMNVIDRQRGGGSTELLPALKRALALPRSKATSTTIVALTDGYVSIEKEAFEVIRRGLGEANLFAFGIGSSVNRHLIEGMARAGMGEPFVVLNSAEAPAKAAAFKKYIESPVLTNIAVRLDGFDAYDLEPATIPDLFSERPIVVFGKYRGRASGRLAVEGTNGNGRFSSAIEVASAPAGDQHRALRSLWARHRIADLSDYATLGRDASVVEEITKLGLRYNLMTEHTSFVAVDSLVRNAGGNVSTVSQPLPLPQGVSNLALGSRSYAARPGSPVPKTRAPARYRRAEAAEQSALGGLGRGSVSPAADAPAVALPSADPKPVDGDESVRTEDKKRDLSKPQALDLERRRVLRVLSLKKSHLAKCYEASGGDAASRNLELELTLAKNGRASKLVLRRGSGAPAVDACLVGRIRALRFERPHDQLVFILPLVL